MALTLVHLLESGVLFFNALAILNEKRVLKKYGLDKPGAAEGLRQQIAMFLYAVRTYLSINLGKERSRVSTLGSDQFAYRHFKDSDVVTGTKITDFNAQQFLDHVNDLRQSSVDKGIRSKFNLLVVLLGSLTVSYFVRDQTAILRSGYKARDPGELPVLERWINANDLDETTRELLPPAKYLDLILYSRAQLLKEAEATHKPMKYLIPTGYEDSAEYFIISIKAQTENRELPMTPITMMRNCLIAEGGSGVPLDRAEYLKAVEFWQHHCMLC